MSQKEIEISLETSGEKNNPYTEHKEAMKLMKEECKEHNASDRNGKMMVFSECDQDNHHWMKEI